MKKIYEYRNKSKSTVLFVYILTLSRASIFGALFTTATDIPDLLRQSSTKGIRKEPSSRKLFIWSVGFGFPTSPLIMRAPGLLLCGLISEPRQKKGKSVLLDDLEDTPFGPLS